MSNQINSTLGDLVKEGGGIIHTGPFGSQLHAEDYVAQGIPCIMPANMKDNRVDLSNISYISDEDAQRLSKYLVKAGDIVYSRRGNVTLKALIRKNEAGYFCGTGCLLLRPGNLLDSDYLTYYLSTPKIQSWLISQAIGATMPNLNTGILARIPFSGPEKSIQEKISSVLRAIDDKLELNNRINAELEAMAKTLYDYWFVQFDFPDANGNPYKTSGGKMVYNATLKREIPMGWEIKKISEVALVKAGGDKPGSYSDFRSDEFSIPVFSNGVSSEGLYGYTNVAVVNKPSITVSARGTIGYSVLRLKPFFPIIRLLVLTPYQDNALKFLEETIKRLSFENSGSVQQQLTVPQISEISVLYPTEQLLNIYTKRIWPLIKKMELIKEQSSKLQQLRDWLLPLLMNGQVTVK